MNPERLIAGSASPPRETVAAPASSWQRTLSSVAEALFESERGPAEAERVAWVVDDIDHFLMTVGGRTRLVIRLAVETVGRLGPLMVGSLGPFERLPLPRRQAALARLERSPAGLTVFALKTLLSLHWFEHPKTVRELGLENRRERSRGAR